MLIARAVRALLAATVVFALVLLAGCGTKSATSGSSTANSTPPVELSISAASSLQALIEKTAPAYEKANNVKLVLNFGASGVLQKQIEGGSPTDVFLSAASTQIDALVKGNLISVESTVAFAGNDLVIMVPKGNPKGIHGAADLAKATRLTTGDPAVAPHGVKAQEWLTGLGLWDSLKPKFVFAQNAAQTDDYVARGEVDAGIGYASDAKARTDLEVAYTVPSNQIKPIKYFAAPIKASTHAAEAAAYVKYLNSAEFQQALVDAGFKQLSK